MKTVFLLLLLCLGTVSIAQAAGPSKYSSRIVQDDKILAIKIDGFQGGRKIYFDRTFDVSSLNFIEKKVLKYRVFHSLGLSLPANDLRELIFAAIGLLTVLISAMIVGYRALRVR